MAKLTKINEIGPVYQALLKLAAANISFRDDVIQKVIQDQVDKVQSLMEKDEEIKTKPFDIQHYLADAQSSLSRLQDQNFKNFLLSSLQKLLNEASIAIQTKNIEDEKKLQTEFHQLIQKTTDYGLKNSYDTIRDFYNLCYDISWHLNLIVRKDEKSLSQKVEEFHQELEKEHLKAKQQAASLKAKIQQLISVSLPKELNVQIELKPEIGTDADGVTRIYPLGFSVKMDFGFETMPPHISLFPREDENYEVDDVLDFGDKDFFTGQGDSEFYFNLVNFLRTGRLPAEEPVKFITLYRGMSNEEFMAWLSGQTIPKGKFFTSQKTQALAQDISGQFPELFTFKVRSDATRQTTKGTYQLIKDCQMDQNKRITPI